MLADELTHPRIGTCLSAIVALVIGPLIEFLPQGLRLPRSQFRLQFWIKLIYRVRFDLEQLTKMSIMTKYGLKSGGIAKLIEDLASYSRLR